MTKDFLSVIVDHKTKEIAQARKNISEEDLKKEAGTITGKRPFYDTLKSAKKTQVNVIAEIKRASPSKGDIAIDLDPADIAAQYEQGGAACLSVLTDNKFFKGGFSDFRSARMASKLPMLRKDFLISDYQVYESVVLGADAILLIARILSKEKLKSLLDLSRDLGLDALVEIHSEADLEAANYAGAKLIGINNRNLSSFETDIGIATTLAEALDSNQIAVAASGISTADDILLNLKAGVNNFLIGESLVKADNTVSFLQSLIACGK